MTTDKPDIAIIGAGIIGCAVARELASRGVRCALFDDRPVAGGATQASAGMLAPYVEAHEPGPLLEAGVRSLSLYDAWIEAVREESGLGVEYRRIGTLEVALDPKSAGALSVAASRAPSLRTLMTGAEVARQHPALGTVAGGVWTRAHGYVAASELAIALAGAAARRGACVSRSRVRAIEPSERGVRVRTESDVVEAGGAVMAAGAWSNAIAGVRLPPVRPVRGQLLRLGWRGHPLATIVWGPGCYIVPRLDGTMLVGATVEDVGFDERNTVAGIRGLLDAACDLLPAASGATFIEARVGLRPATPDALPVIGPDPHHRTVVHASGHYRNGVLLAPITAQVIGDWMVDGRRDPMFDLFSPDRF